MKKTPAEVDHRILAHSAELDRITDMVLAYKPKPKSKGAKRRVRRAKKAKADE